MKLKVCGMKYKDNIEGVARLLPDYLGFIFYDKSTRFVKDNVLNVPKSIKKVGVFVDAPMDQIIQTVSNHNLNAVQLHGDESPEFCSELQAHFKKANSNLVSSDTDDYSKIEIIKVFSIKDDFDFSVLQEYENVCDYFLFDTKGKLPGGNGYTFDWKTLNNYTSEKPYFLSGGIGLDEIENLKKFMLTKASLYCYAIDINSKFEIEPGLKDVQNIIKFKNEIILNTH